MNQMTLLSLAPGSQEGGGESLVAIVCACANFSAILQNPDTRLYMSATLNVVGQSILVAQNRPGPYRSVSQVDTVRAIFDRKDSFVCLPTGYGKSLCYQSIPFFKDFKLGCAGYCFDNII